MKPSLPLLLLLTASGCSLHRQEARPGPQTDARAQGKALYSRHCASCHGEQRLGSSGPALIPETLERLKKPEALQVISRGRPSTQMAAFGAVLTEAEIGAVAEYLYAPVEFQPVWGEPEILSSIRLPPPEKPLSSRPIFRADPWNLFFVVELADHAITILDGDRFEPIHRFQTRFAVHGGVKYSSDGRFAYLISRDGWLTRFDIYNLRIAGEVRVAFNSRNVAVSPDGKLLAVANTLPGGLVILDAETLRPLKIHVAAADGKSPSRFSAVYTAHPRGSFVASLKDRPELWELRLPGTGEPRRLPAAFPLDDFYFDPKYAHVFGSGRGSKEALVLSLDTGKERARVPVQGMPHLASGISFVRNGRRLMASPNLGARLISFVDTESWQTIAELETPAAGFFLRSHEKSPYAFADVFFGKEKDTILVISKQSLKVEKLLRPSPGKTAAHCEFTKDGRYALISIWEDDGAIVVYDAKTLREVKRIPMRKPSGKYNVHNKVNLSEGTSH